MTSYTVITLHKKLSFPLRISSVTVTKSAAAFAEKIINEKLYLLCSVSFCVV